MGFARVVGTTPRYLLPILLLATAGCFSVGKLTEDDKKAAELSTGDVVEVTKIIKGDEVVVEKEGRTAKVRLFGVHAYDDVIVDPDLDRLRKASVGYLTDTVLGKKVSVTLDKPLKDAHGRYLAYVDLAGKDVNAALVGNGLLMVYTEYPFAREGAYLEAEKAARGVNKGIWGGDKPMRIARGLRKQWAELREQRGAPAAADALLAEAETPAPAPSGSEEEKKTEEAKPGK